MPRKLSFCHATSRFPAGTWLLIAGLFLIFAFMLWSSLKTERVGLDQGSVLEIGTPNETSTEQRQFATIRLGERTFTAVVSNTPAQIIQGLSDRNTIGADAMLFVLPQPQQTPFWMYHMRFPLDFLWISDMTIVDLHENVPAVPLTTPAQEIPQVMPSVPVQVVLEVPAGFVRQYGIQKGQPIGIEFWPDQVEWKGE